MLLNNKQILTKCSGLSLDGHWTVNHSDTAWRAGVHFATTVLLHWAPQKRPFQTAAIAEIAKPAQRDATGLCRMVYMCFPCLPYAYSSSMGLLYFHHANTVPS